MSPALIVLCVLFLLFILVLFLRVGVAVEYAEDGLTLWVKIGAVRLRVFPRKPKPPKQKRVKKPKKVKKKVRKNPEKEPEPRPGGGLDEWLSYLDLFLEAAGKLRRALRIDRLTLHLLWAGDDPASTAITYGYANSVLGTALPLIENTVRLGERDIQTAISFDAKRPVIYAKAEVSMRIGRILALLLPLTIQLIKIYLGRKDKKKEASL